MNLESRKILLVEDELLIAYTQQRQLENAGCLVTIAPSGEKAVSFFLNEYFDLVLMDINLGKGIDGIEAAAKMQQIRDVPVIFLTNNTTDEVMLRTEQVTSYGYLLKALSESILFTSISTALKLFESRLEQERMKALLVKNQNRLEYILYGTNVGTWEWNVQTGETSFNDRWAGIIGYELEELGQVSIETWVKYAHPDDLLLSNERLQKHFSGETSHYSVETRMKHKDGSWVWVLDTGRVVSWTEDGKPLWMYGTHQDITAIKKVEEELRHTADMNQRLLTELKHRVKNSFTILDSLMSFIRSSSKANDNDWVLMKLNAAIKSLGKLYEVLYSSSSSTHEVRLDLYLEKIVNSFVVLHEHIQFKVELDEVKVPVRVAESLGLIVTELLTNAAKYAYPDHAGGIVETKLCVAPGGAAVNLSVRDFGRGIIDLDTPDRTPSFGMRLVEGLTQEIGGNLHLDSSGGTCWVINFAFAERSPGI